MGSRFGDDAPSIEKTKIHPLAITASIYGADCHPKMEVRTGVTKRAVIDPMSVPDAVTARRVVFSE